jgi:hypothetical protein
MAGTEGNVNLEELIAALADAAIYPHPVKGLHVVQTHTSCVALTGEVAYKVKKPVDFGFLDYSTPDKRRALCEVEIRLNQRLCPDVYLDVVPLVRTPDGLRFGVEGPVVDWAVRMRQLPESDMLPVRLRSDAVTLEQVERIAGLLASFHARSPEHAVDRFGSPDQISENVLENLSGLLPLVGAELSPDQLAALGGYAERFLSERRELFEQRVRSGHIRDGHGDLRAQNLCLFPGLQDGVQIFDCIEFNDRFRYGDVACDLAYLAMDLDLAGRRDLRETLISAYEREAKDRVLRVVLPFYLCYRACVRGKIALFAAAEEEVPPLERAEHRKLAAAAFDLAWSYTQHQARPTLWITVGFSGSGKSALAHELARRLPAVHLSSDRIRKELAGMAPETRLPDDSYEFAAVARVYDELRRRADPLLRQGVDVILDATFLSLSERDKTRRLATECGADLQVLACECPDAEIRRRLQARTPGAHASDAGLAVYDAQLRRHDEVAANEAPIRVSTNQPPSQAAREVLVEQRSASGVERPGSE